MSDTVFNVECEVWSVKSGVIFENVKEQALFRIKNGFTIFREAVKFF